LGAGPALAQGPPDNKKNEGAAVKEISIGEIDGFLVGHAESAEFKTGVTVILAPKGAPASAYVPGFAPGTREVELLDPKNLVPMVHAVALAGGSAFGLASGAGVVRWLTEQGLGFDVGDIKVPIVTGAVIYDYPGNLSQGKLPDENMGYEAAKNAKSGPVESGPVGAGVSAMSGRLAPNSQLSQSGIGSYGIELPSGLQIAAIAVVNPVGSVVDPKTGQIVSGARRPDGTLMTREEILQALSGEGGESPADAGTRTVICAVATNAKLDKLDAHRLARMASAGVTRAVYPAHLLFDGDSVFALGAPDGKEYDVSYLGALAADVLAEAVLRSVPRESPKP
jgi:L-aminopeptidase/D-esterase-like protein